MITFWLICAVFVAIALAFVIPPLLPGKPKAENGDEKEANIDVYRDQLSELDADLQHGIISQEQYQQDKDEIERRLLEDVGAAHSRSAAKPRELTARGPVYAIAILVPVIATAFYLRVGNPAAMSPSAGRAQAPSSASSQRGSGAPPMSQQDIEGNVAKLAKRMEQNPGDFAGWSMLGRSYLSLQKYTEASDAYAKAVAIKVDDADLWADYAFAMGMANGKSLAGRPAELIKKALSLDPNNPKALELAGSAAFEAKNYKEAISFWQRLLEKTPKESELRQALIERIDQAKAESGSSTPSR